VGRFENQQKVGGRTLPLIYHLTEFEPAA